MGKISKVIRYEGRKLLAGWRTLLVVLLVFSVFFALINVFLSQNVGEEIREDHRELLEKGIQENYETLAAEYPYLIRGEIPPDYEIMGIYDKEQFIADALQRYQYYKFLFESGTIDDDYVEIRNQLEARAPHRGSYFMLGNFNYVGYLMPVLAVLSALWIFRLSEKKPSVKHELASPLGRKNLVAGKLLALGLLLLALCLLLGLYCLIWGLQDLGGSTLYYDGEQYVAISCLSVFFSRWIGLCLNMLIVGYFTALMSCLMRNEALSATLAVIFYALFPGAYLILRQGLNLIDGYPLMQCIPLMNVTNHIAGMGDWTFWLVWLGHLLVIAGLAWLVRKHFQKLSF